MLLPPAVAVAGFPRIHRGGHGSRPRPVDTLQPSPLAAGSSACNTSYPRANPIFTLREGRVRDPAVLLSADGGLELFFTHFRGKNPKSMWGGEAVKKYAVRRVHATADWASIGEPLDATPAGYVSPDVVTWANRTILAYTAYPDRALGGKTSGLYYSRRLDRAKLGWSKPRPFLPEALELPWNTARRAIDPTLVVGPDGRLHCFFVGAAHLPDAPTDGGRRDGEKGGNEKGGKRRRANLLGHAVTSDPELREWRVLTREAPLLGVSARAPERPKASSTSAREHAWRACIRVTAV